jgi:hypothetical protein
MYLNGRFVSGCWMVRYSNGIQKPDQFVWFLNGRPSCFCPTQKSSGKWPFEYRTVRFSDNDCISCAVFEWLDHFIHKRKKIFCIKLSRLVEQLENQTRNRMITKLDDFIKKKIIFITFLCIHIQQSRLVEHSKTGQMVGFQMVWY